MTNPINKIVDNKEKTREKLNILRRSYLTTIYRGILKKTDWYKIHDKLLKDTINFKKLDVFSLFFVANKIYLEAKPYRDMTNAPLLLFLFLDEAYHSFAKPINSLINQEENNLKQQFLNNTIKNAREDKQIFYLCSSHKDCAKDHLDYQGKIYVDEEWDSIEYSQDILDFLNNNRILTVQEVTEGRPYLLTRPNCRHFIKSIPTMDALTQLSEDLLKKYDMEFDSGYDSPAYKPKAAKEKLKFYEEMYKINKNPKILEKIRFYENYLQNYKK